MTARNDTEASDSEVSMTVYNGGDGEDIEPPVAFIHLEQTPQSVDFGDGGQADVAVNGDYVSIEVTGRLENAERLIDRDILAVSLSAKDLPEGDDVDE